MDPLDPRLLDAADRGFDAPWQARAVALAVETVDRLGLGWDDFRTRLMDQVARRSDDDHYAAWVAALESLVADHGVAGADDLARRRLDAAEYVTVLDGEPAAIVALSPASGVVEAVIAELVAAGLDVAIESSACRHLEVQSMAGVHRLVAYGTDDIELLDIALDSAVAERVVERYAGAEG